MLIQSPWQNFTDASGNVIRSVDKANDLEFRADFDTLGRLISKDVFDTTVTGRNDRWTRSVEYDYDIMNNLSKLTFAYKDGTHNTTNYLYDSNNRPLSAVVQSGKTFRIYYDGLNRVTKTKLNTTTPIETVYTYVNSGSNTTNVLDTEISNSFAYRYSYDNNGNIKAIDNGEILSDGTYSFIALTGNSYDYDKYNQLVKDTNYVTGDITTYTYDTNGNITQKEVANGRDSIITTYTYGDTSWGDLLTAYNGQSITYDTIGNPLNYRDGITMTWKNGRELATFKKGTVDVSYTYDPNGLRTSKSVVEDFVSTDYEYIYENGLLRQMTYGNHIFNFSYDANGTPVSLNHVITTSGLNEYYYYSTNSRGDVEALYYSDGSLYVTYEYDAYGKLMGITSAAGSDLTNTDTVATKNPLRYRSYVYDTETGLYYLQSRYYDPTTCRFVNADSYISTGQDINGYNMFAYCNNNPVMCSDPCGNRPVKCCPNKNCIHTKQNINFIQSSFGAGSSTVDISTLEYEMIAYPANQVVTAKEGVEYTRIISEKGDSSKPLSVYAEARADNYLLSSVGVKINGDNNTSTKLNLSLDNIGITVCNNSANQGGSFGIVLDITQFKIGIEWSYITWDNNDVVRVYKNVSVTGQFLALLYGVVYGGGTQPAPTPVPSY